jgi:hypothetical protein
VYTKLGDVRELAVTQSKVADIMKARGDLDGAITLYRDQALPALRKLAARDQVAQGQANLALMLMQRGATGDHEEALALLAHAYAEAKAMRLALAGQLEEAFPFLKSDSTKGT